MMIGLQVDVDKTVQVLWGRATIPNVEGFLDTGFALKDGRIIFAIRGQVKRKDLPEVKKIAALTREIATQESVYKGKAIRIAFEKVTPENFNPDDAMPTFFGATRARTRLVSGAMMKPIPAPSTTSPGTSHSTDPVPAPALMR